MKSNISKLFGILIIFLIISSPVSAQACLNYAGVEAVAREGLQKKEGYDELTPEQQQTMLERTIAESYRDAIAKKYPEISSAQMTVYLAQFDSSRALEGTYRTLLGLEAEGVLREEVIDTIKGDVDNAVEERIEELKDDLATSTSVHDRVNSVLALGRIGDRSAIPALIEALDDPEERVAMQAVRVLAEMSDIQSLGPLKALANAGRSTAITTEAEVAVVTIEDANRETIIKELVEGLRSEDEFEEEDAFFDLIRLGSPAIEPLMAVLHDPEFQDIHGVVADVLGEIADKSDYATLRPLADPLIELLKNPQYKGAYRGIATTLRRTIIKGRGIDGLGRTEIANKAVGPLTDILNNPEYALAHPEVVMTFEPISYLAGSEKMVPALVPLIDFLKNPNFRDHHKDRHAYGAAAQTIANADVYDDTNIP
ncbi:HEAT repeat domain-containing protein, partial [Nanoarchaeota archaeon]